MDLDRMKQPDREALCRQYFYLGFAGLPFLWAVNVVWFGNLVFFKKQPPPTPNGPTSGQQNNHQQSQDVRQRNNASTNHGNAESSIQQADIDLDMENSMKRIRCYVILSFI